MTPEDRTEVIVDMVAQLANLQTRVEELESYIAALKAIGATPGVAE